MLVGNISTGNLSIAANAALTMQNRETDSSCKNETAVMPTDSAMIMSRAGITEASETYGKTGKTTGSDNSKKWINPQMKKETEDIMEKVKGADFAKLEDLFGKDSDFVNKVEFLSTRISDNAKANVESLSSAYNANGDLYSAMNSSKYDFWG